MLVPCRRLKRGIVLSPQVTSVVTNGVQENHGRPWKGEYCGPESRMLVIKGVPLDETLLKLKVEHVRQTRVGKFSIYSIMMVYREGSQGIISEITDALLFGSVYI